MRYHSSDAGRASATPASGEFDIKAFEAARTFAVCGTPDDVAAEINSIANHADSLCVKPPMWGIDPADAVEQAQRLERILLG